MGEAAFYQQKRGHPTALAVVILMHGAAIGTLALAKMEVISNPFKPIKIIDIKEALPPPPEPQPKVEKVQPTQEVVIDRPPPIVDMAKPGPVTEWKPLPTPTLVIPDPGPTIVLPRADPPTPPEPKKLEPARAKANLASYVSDADYPSAAIRNEDEGTTRFRLGVGRDGRVTECTVTASSGSSALDSATCKLMKQRARFTPARDSNGNSTTDTVTSGIRWVLPD